MFLGATGQDICPVRAMANFLATRSPAPGPLFVFGSGSPLSREILVSRVQSALAEAGLKHTAYKGHSFRIGAATTAAKQGFEDSLIQTLGCWKSAAYLTYIKIPRQELAAVAPALLGGRTIPRNRHSKQGDTGGAENNVQRPIYCSPRCIGTTSNSELASSTVSLLIHY